MIVARRNVTEIDNESPSGTKANLRGAGNMSLSAQLKYLRFMKMDPAAIPVQTSVDSDSVIKVIPLAAHFEENQYQINDSEAWHRPVEDTIIQLSVVAKD